MQDLGGIKIGGIAADSQDNIDSAKSLITDLSETDLGKQISEAQANGRAKAPVIVINSGTHILENGSKNFILNESFIFIDTNSQVTTFNTHLAEFVAPWERILTHEMAHLLSPDEGLTINRTNSVRHIWSGQNDREPLCGDFGC